VTSPISRFHCPRCNRLLRSPKLYPLHCPCGNVILGGPEGQPLVYERCVLGTGTPGTKLREIMRDLGVEEKPNCSCKLVARKMDAWGVEGCSLPKNHAWIVEQIRANAAKWTWAEKLGIAMRAATSELMLVIDPLDVYGSLVNEAIRRAAASASTPETP